MKNSQGDTAATQEILEALDSLVLLLERLTPDSDEELADEVDNALDDIGRIRQLLKRLP